MSNIPPAVRALLIANGVMYVLQFIFGAAMVKTLGLTPNDVLTGPLVYQLFTYMFLHGGLFHIFMNMFILWMFGTELEYAWGPKPFLKYYFLTGIAGGVFTVAFMPSSTIPTIGASGAIYGLLAAYALMFPNRYIYLFFLFPIKVKYAVIFFVAFEFLASFNAVNSSVGHLAHLGGAVVGFLYLKLDWRLKNIFGWLSPMRWFKRLRYRKKSRKLEKNRQRTEEIMQRVDQILDKINAVGYENITQEERDFLGNASEMLSKKEK